MKWVKKRLDSLLSFGLRLLFGRGTYIGNKYGVSFDNRITISSLPSPMPKVSDFYEIVPEKLIFEVMDVNVENNLVYLREVGSDTLYPINAELFIMLFVKNDSQYDVNKFK